MKAKKVMKTYKPSGSGRKKRQGTGFQYLHLMTFLDKEIGKRM